MKSSDFKKILLMIVRNSIFQHFLFWTFSYYVLLTIFASENYNILENLFNPVADNIYTLIFLFTIFLAVLVNLYILVPLLLKRNYFVLYVFAFLANLVLFSLFNQELFSHWIDYILPGFYFISYYELIDIMTFFAAFLISTTLLKLSKEWFELNQSKQQLVRLEKEKAEVELKALMGQINPHFLFNSLNVLYSLALNSSKETPAAIIKLSDILRYVIYEAGKNEVTLKSEVALISNYIDLQLYRSEDNYTINFEKQVKDENFKIAPMLFLPLVENSFKHGIKGTIENGYVVINLQAGNTKIEFFIENNIGSAEKIEKDSRAGIGLKNIAERLQLLYPDRHHFEINDGQDKFTVRLILDVS